MTIEEEPRQNQQAYRRLRKRIDQSYPTGHYIGIVRGKIVADDPDLRRLISKLDAIERHPDRRLVVQAGVEYPTRIVRLLNQTRQHSASDVHQVKEGQ